MANKNSANGVQIYGSSNQSKKETSKIKYGTDLRAGKGKK
jgi:hypothetical protein